MSPRASYYRKHKSELLKEQQKRRKNVKKALEELARLEKLEQQKLDVESFEGQAIKNLVKKQLIEDQQDPEKIEGGSPWQ